VCNFTLQFTPHKVKKRVCNFTLGHVLWRFTLITSWLHSKQIWLKISYRNEIDRNETKRNNTKWKNLTLMKNLRKYRLGVEKIVYCIPRFVSFRFDFVSHFTGTLVKQPTKSKDVCVILHYNLHPTKSKNVCAILH
jgi:hypothetical protein